MSCFCWALWFCSSVKSVNVTNRFSVWCRHSLTSGGPFHTPIMLLPADSSSFTTAVHLPLTPSGPYCGRLQQSRRGWAGTILKLRPYSQVVYFNNRTLVCSVLTAIEIKGKERLGKLQCLCGTFRLFLDRGLCICGTDDIQNNTSMLATCPGEDKNSRSADEPLYERKD